jgi:hypothetical protein
MGLTENGESGMNDRGRQRTNGLFVFLAMALLAILCIPADALTTFEIETSNNDDVFIINGEKFEAKTYCFNMEEGDQVIFLEGSPYGACASASLLNLRTKQKCEVWCE